MFPPTEVFLTQATRVIPILGSFASMLGLAIALLFKGEEATPWWAIVLITLGVLLMFWTFISVLRSENKTHYFRLEDRQGIRNYMYRWIRDGGRVAIWTRDMSWASDVEMEQMLKAKATDQALVICLPEDIELTKGLQEDRAEIRTHGVIDSLESRFTIVNLDRVGSRVAVASRKGDYHVIHEFSADDPAFYLARDLVRLVQVQGGASAE